MRHRIVFIISPTEICLRTRYKIPTCYFRKSHPRQKHRIHDLACSYVYLMEPTKGDASLRRLIASVIGRRQINRATFCLAVCDQTQSDDDCQRDKTEYQYAICIITYIHNDSRARSCRMLHNHTKFTLRPSCTCSLCGTT